MGVKNVMKSTILICIIMAGMVYLQGCLGGGEEYYDANKYYEEDIKAIQDYLDGNAINARMDSTTGIFIQTHKRGSGYKTLANIDVELQFKGSTLSGTQFANYYSGAPIQIKIGDVQTYPAGLTNAVIIGISHMNEGDSITVYSPSYFGFQNKTYLNVQPNTPLVYDIKFVKIKNLHEDISKIDQYLGQKGMVADIDSIFGTRTVIHVAGGGLSIDNNDFISLDYQGELLDGTVFDSSFGKSNPLTFTIGKGQLIPGFELGVLQLQMLDSATIFVPSIYGYGNKANGTIPANSVLVFGLKIRDVKKY